MPLETATYLADLVSTNPAATDTTGQGDDHLRLIKSTLKATFPNFTAAALTSTQAQLEAAVTASSTGPLTLAVGTALAPTYSFTGETNTGFYKSAAGVVGLSILGTLEASFAATGFTFSQGLTLSAGNLAVSAGGATVSGDFNTTAGAFKLNGTNIFPLQAANIGALQVLTAAIADANVTYGKIQNVTNGKLLGNFSGAAASPSEYGIGAGLAMSGSNLTAPGFPIPAVFKNLSIKVATGTTVACAADYITVSDGANFRTLAFSGTVNLGVAGALNALDVGTFAANTWYAIWAIAKADGSLPGFLASASFTAPTLPAGYTLSARVGAVVSNATALMGTWQLGRKAQYVVGLAQTTVPPVAASGNSGSPGTPTYTAVSVTPYVPPTASHISVSVYSAGTGRAVAAPNSSYGVYSASNAPPIVNGAASAAGGAVCVIPGTFLLESTNVYYACDAGFSAGLRVDGWEDNI